MIIKRCDFCKKDVDYINTVVLYKKSIDFCEKCRNKAEKVIKDFEREINYENTMKDISLRNKEKNYLKTFKIDK